MTELLIFRHSESVANVKGILAGRIDPTPLSAKGRREAKLLKRVLQDFRPERTISSPLLRCRQTAGLAGAQILELDERIIEMDYGRWSGKSLRVLSKHPRWSHVQRRPEDFVFPGGESFGSALTRIELFLIDLLEGPSQRVALFSHGDVVRILINLALNRRLNQFQALMVEPASYSRLTLRFNENESDRFQTTVHYINRREMSLQRENKGYLLGGEV